MKELVGNFDSHFSLIIGKDGLAQLEILSVKVAWDSGLNGGQKDVDRLTDDQGLIQNMFVALLFELFVEVVWRVIIDGDGVVFAASST